MPEQSKAELNRPMQELLFTLREPGAECVPLTDTVAAVVCSVEADHWTSTLYEVPGNKFSDTKFPLSHFLVGEELCKLTGLNGAIQALPGKYTASNREDALALARLGISGLPG